MDKNEEYAKAYAYALAQEKVEAQLELASLEAEQEFIKANDVSEDYKYNEKRIFVVKAKLKAVSEIESTL